MPAVASRSDVAWVAAQLILFVLIAVFLLGTRGDGPVAISWLGGILAVTGLALAGSALARLGPSVTPYPTPAQGAILVMHGPYRLVRHPIYGGVALTSIGLSLVAWSWPAAVLSVGLLPFFLAKSRHEETLLAARFEGYTDYVAVTRKRLIPWVV